MSNELQQWEREVERPVLMMEFPVREKKVLRIIAEISEFQLKIVLDRKRSPYGEEYGGTV